MNMYNNMSKKKKINKYVKIDNGKSGRLSPNGKL